VFRRFSRCQLRCSESSQIKQHVAMVTNPAIPKIPNEKTSFMNVPR
jgi:hypothetical protein